jgi:hypothetical protein
MRSILFPQLIAEFGGERQVVAGDGGGQFTPKSPLIAEVGDGAAEERRAFPCMLGMPMQAFNHSAKLVAKDVVIARASQPT